MFNKILATGLILIVFWLLWQRLIDQRHIEKLQKENTTIILECVKTNNANQYIIDHLKNKVVNKSIMPTGAMDNPALLRRNE